MEETKLYIVQTFIALCQHVTRASRGRWSYWCVYWWQMYVYCYFISIKPFTTSPSPAIHVGSSPQRSHQLLGGADIAPWLTSQRWTSFPLSPRLLLCFPQLSLFPYFLPTCNHFLFVCLTIDCWFALVNLQWMFPCGLSVLFSKLLCGTEGYNDASPC